MKTKVQKFLEQLITKEQFTDEEAWNIGTEIGVDFDKIDFRQFKMGLEVEMEHGKYPDIDIVHGDPVIAGKIALAHLYEIQDYYTRLKRMEGDAKE
jgi:hypothetical protein